MIKREDLKERMKFTLPIRDMDTFQRYVNYGTEHFSVSVFYEYKGHFAVAHFHVEDVLDKSVKLLVKGAIPYRAMPKKEDFYVFVHNEVLNEVLRAAELCEEPGAVETPPHKEEDAVLKGLTVEQYIQVMEERMEEYFNKEGMNKDNGLMSKDYVRFRGIIDRMYETFKEKNADYGNSFRELYKECGMTYAYGHMREKLERVRSLMKNEAQVKGESMKDSLYDLANYAVLTIMEMERNIHEGEESPSHKEK